MKPDAHPHTERKHLLDDTVEEPLAVPIEDSIDLHTFRPRDVKAMLPEYIAECVKAGFHEVRIIHGRGTGNLRQLVRSQLERLPAVARYHDAPADRGGWGATVAILSLDDSDPDH